MLLTLEQIDLFKQAILQGRIEVLLFDLETSPSKFWGWGTGEQYVSYNMLVEGTETKVITSQYKKLLVDKEAKYLVWDWNGVQGGDDSSLVEETVRLVNNADIVIGQNVNNFDIKVLQERAKILRLSPISIDFPLDTLTTSRKSFKSMSHRLDYRSKQHGLGGKIKMEMQDWIDILEGRVSPEEKMVPYGLKDVEDTEEVFWRELPYWNLPKTTVNKILKLIVGMVESKKELNNKPFCKYCAKAKQRKFDVSMHEDENGKHILCNVCGETS
jgi:DNA polymerase elongation subunit (family B)